MPRQQRTRRPKEAEEEEAPPGEDQGAEQMRAREDEERRKEVFAKGYLSRALPAAQLLKRLKKLAFVLVSFQDAPSAEMKAAAQATAAPYLLKHENAEVRELVACCLADTLRVFAPDAPYSRGQIRGIFALIVRQVGTIAGARGANSYKRVFHLLETLAEVRICNVLVELGEHRALAAVFEKLFELAALDLEAQRNVDNYCVEIMRSALEEADRVPRLLLSTVLAQLAAPLKRTNAAGCAMAATLITRVQTKIEVPVTAFLKQALVRCTLGEEAGGGGGVGARRRRKKRRGDDSDDSDDGEDDDSAEDDDGYSDDDDDDDDGGEQGEVSPNLRLRTHKDVLGLMEELIMRCPTVLLPLQQEMQDLAEVADVHKRLEMVRMCGRVFSADGAPADLAREFDQLFDAFLRRFGDIQVAVREQMCRLGAPLAVRFADYPAAQARVVQRLREKLDDRDERVRLAAVVSLCEVARDHASAVPATTVREVGKRFLDKRPGVRRESMVRMSALFAHHCSSRWKDARQLPPEATKAFQWIPNQLMLCYTLDTPTSFVVESLLCDKIMDQKYTLVERARCMVGVFCSLTEDSERMFSKMLERKQRAAALLRQALVAGERARAGAGEAFEHRAAAAAAQLARFVPCDESSASGTAAEMALALVTHKDRRVPRLLSVLADPHSALDELRAAAKELRRAAAHGGNAGLGEYARRVAARCASAVVSCDALPALFREVHDTFAASRRTLNRNAFTLGLLAHVTARQPGLLSAAASEDAWGNVDDLFRIIQLGEPRLAGPALRMLSRVCVQRTAAVPAPGAEAEAEAEAEGGGRALPRAQQRLRDRVTAELRERCVRGDPSQVKFAVRALHSLHSPGMGGTAAGAAALLGEVMDEAAGVMDESAVADPAPLHAAMRCAQEVARRCPAAYAPHRDAVDVFVADELLCARPPDAVLGDEAAVEHLACAAVCGLKAAVYDVDGRCAAAPQDRASAAATEAKGELQRAAAPLMDLLVRTVSADGDPKRANTMPREFYDTLALTAAKGLLRLACSWYLASMVRPRHFQELFMVAHHDAVEVRRSFNAHVVKLISSRQLNFKYSVFIALAGIDRERGAQDRARLQLVQLVRDRRLRIARMIARRAASGGGQQHVVRADAMPEYALVHLLHLLAHHPDFQLEAGGRAEQETTRLMLFKRMVDFFVDALLEAGVAGAGAGGAAADAMAGHNYGFMLQLLQVIKQHEDAWVDADAAADADGAAAANAHNVHVLADLCRESLRRKYQGREWSDARHPSAISLPADLYRRPARADPKAAQRQYLPESFLAALAPVGGGGGGGSGASKQPGAGASPAKPRRKSGGAANARTPPARARAPRARKRPSPAGSPESPPKRSRRSLGRRAKEAGAAAVDDDAADEALERRLEAYEEEQNRGGGGGDDDGDDDDEEEEEDEESDDDDDDDDDDGGGGGGGGGGGDGGEEESASEATSEEEGEPEPEPVLQKPRHRRQRSGKENAGGVPASGSPKKRKSAPSPAAMRSTFRTTNGRRARRRRA